MTSAKKVNEAPKEGFRGIAGVENREGWGVMAEVGLEEVWEGVRELITCDDEGVDCKAG